ncbi:MAG: hypothetical protein SFZ03_04860 [Candidatus Melainabacteria bacterium]|nr:hypothetical protein [Candidatus Melainabacteria bacterium]
MRLKTGCEHFTLAVANSPALARVVAPEQTLRMTQQLKIPQSLAEQFAEQPDYFEASTTVVAANHIHARYRAPASEKKWLLSGESSRTAKQGQQLVQSLQDDGWQPYEAIQSLASAGVRSTQRWVLFASPHNFIGPLLYEPNGVSVFPSQEVSPFPEQPYYQQFASVMADSKKRLMLSEKASFVYESPKQPPLRLSQRLYGTDDGYGNHASVYGAPTLPHCNNGRDLVVALESLRKATHPETGEPLYPTLSVFANHPFESYAFLEDTALGREVHRLMTRCMPGYAQKPPLKFDPQWFDAVDGFEINASTDGFGQLRSLSELWNELRNHRYQTYNPNEKTYQTFLNESVRRFWQQEGRRCVLMSGNDNHGMQLEFPRGSLPDRLVRLLFPAARQQVVQFQRPGFSLQIQPDLTRMILAPYDSLLSPEEGGSGGWVNVFHLPKKALSAHQPLKEQALLESAIQQGQFVIASLAGISRERLGEIDCRLEVPAAHTDGEPVAVAHAGQSLPLPKEGEPPLCLVVEVPAACDIRVYCNGQPFVSQPFASQPFTPQSWQDAYDADRAMQVLKLPVQQPGVYCVRAEDHVHHRTILMSNNLYVLPTANNSFK